MTTNNNEDNNSNNGHIVKQGFLTESGTFSIDNVQNGVYKLEVFSPDFAFPVAVVHVCLYI